jgi:hypothetical protein
MASNKKKKDHSPKFFDRSLPSKRSTEVPPKAEHFLKKLALTTGVMLNFYAFIGEDGRSDPLTLGICLLLSWVMAILIHGWAEDKRKSKVLPPTQQELKKKFYDALAKGYFVSAFETRFHWKNSLDVDVNLEIEDLSKEKYPLLVRCAENNTENPMGDEELKTLSDTVLNRIYPYSKAEMMQLALEFYNLQAASLDHDHLPVPARTIWAILECVLFLYEEEVPVLMLFAGRKAMDGDKDPAVAQELLGAYLHVTQLLTYDQYKTMMQETFLPNRLDVIYSAQEKESQQNAISDLAIRACCSVQGYWADEPHLPYFEAWSRMGRKGWPTAHPAIAAFTDDEIKMAMTVYMVKTSRYLRKDWCSHNPYIYGILSNDKSYTKGGVLGTIDTILNTTIPTET